MYVRLARFEGAEPPVMERMLEDMRRQIQSGQWAEADTDQPGGGPNREQTEMLQAVTKRVLVLADRRKGSSAMLIFVDSEDDARKVDQTLNQMAPPDEGGGRRQSADVYEVVMDEQINQG